MRHIPNIISVFRICIIPVFIWQMAGGQHMGAAAVLVVSGFSDMADGFLARRYGWISGLGKILDPVADKLTQTAVCVTLILTLREYRLFFALLLVKDLIMLILGGYLVRKGVHLSGAKWFGKTVTILFYIIMTLIVFLPGIPDRLVFAMLCSVTACAYLAGLLYIPEFLRYRRGIGADAGEYLQ